MFKTIQAAILIGNYLGGEGDVIGKHIYIGIARLHAQAIRLWEVGGNPTIIEREIRRRTWLSVVISEEWSAADLATQPTISSEYACLFQILDDVEFMAIEPGLLENSANLRPPTHGLWAQMAATADVFRQISDIIRNLGSKIRPIQSY